jgi:hypothetical protein
VGKSTLAESLYLEIPLSFHLDMDAQRRFISQYRELNKESFELSIPISLAIADACLAAGKDVVLDKIFRRKESALEQFIEIAKKNGAEIHEFILWADKETTIQRAKERGYREGGLLTPEKVAEFWEHLSEFKKTRKDAIVLDAQNKNANELLTEVKKHLDI